MWPSCPGALGQGWHAALAVPARRALTECLLYARHQRPSDLQMCSAVEFGIHWGAANGVAWATEMKMNMEMEIR